MNQQRAATRWFKLMVLGMMVAAGLVVGFGLNHDKPEPEAVHVLLHPQPKIVVRAEPPAAVVLVPAQVPEPSDTSVAEEPIAEPLPEPKTDRERAKRIYDALRQSSTPTVDLASAFGPFDDRTIDVVWSIMWTMANEDENEAFLDMLADRTYVQTPGFEMLKAVEHALKEPSDHAIRALRIADHYDVLHDETANLLGDPKTHKIVMEMMEDWPDRKSRIEQFLKRTPKSNEFYIRMANEFMWAGGKRDYAKKVRPKKPKRFHCGLHRQRYLEANGLFD